MYFHAPRGIWIIALIGNIIALLGGAFCMGVGIREDIPPATVGGTFVMLWSIFWGLAAKPHLEQDRSEPDAKPRRH